ARSIRSIFSPAAPETDCGTNLRGEWLVPLRAGSLSPIADANSRGHSPQCRPENRGISCRSNRTNSSLCHAKIPALAGDMSQLKIAPPRESPLARLHFSCCPHFLTKLCVYS